MWGFIASAGHEHKAIGVWCELKQRRETGYVTTIAIAWWEIALKHFESSIDWLMIALEEGSRIWPLSDFHPLYDPIS
jgi:hypothetical protein